MRNSMNLKKKNFFLQSPFGRLLHVCRFLMWQYRSACTKKHTHGTREEMAEAKAMPEWTRRIPRKLGGEKVLGGFFFFMNLWQQFQFQGQQFDVRRRGGKIWNLWKYDLRFNRVREEEERAANKWELRTDKNCHKSPTGKSPSLGKCQIFQFRWNGKPVREKSSKSF